MRLAMAIAVIASLPYAGCGPSRPATVRVEGTVTLDGQPVEGAAVQFIPASGSPAHGLTDAAGRFTLTTFDDGDGAMPGQHRITVQKNKVTGAAADEHGLETGVPTSPPAIEWLIPEKYSQPDTSGLTAEVQRGLPPIELKLESAKQSP